MSITHKDISTAKMSALDKVVRLLIHNNQDKQVSVAELIKMSDVVAAWILSPQLTSVELSTRETK